MDCGNECHKIYPRYDTHSTMRRPGKCILGNKAQFCASFYHVHKWGVRDHFCLDENNCSIAERAKKANKWTIQPKTVVALAKFEVDEVTKYEARYTNCYTGKEHAEDLLDFDIQQGELNEAIAKAEESKPRSMCITLYLTYQPCNKSTGGTSGTEANQSCCESLRKVYSEVLKPKNIGLSIKATHVYRLDENPASDARNNEYLQGNAKRGIQNLMESGVSVNGMTKKDWEYLFTLTTAENPDNDSRNTLDDSIEETFITISTGQTETPAD